MKIQCIVMPKSQKIGLRSVEFQNNQYIVRIALRSAPEKNKANIELIDILSNLFSVKKSSISLVLGAFSRKKLISFDHLSDVDEKNILSKLIFLLK